MFSDNYAKQWSRLDYEQQGYITEHICNRYKTYGALVAQLEK